MRDHLLGCQQFMPPEDDGLTRHQRPFALGVPERLRVGHHARYAKAAAEQAELIDFEYVDKTPEAMRADFPHEYVPEDGICEAFKLYVDPAKDRDHSAFVEYYLGKPVSFCDPYPPPKDRNWLTGNFDDMVREANAQTCSNVKPPENKTASGLSMLMDASRKLEERWNSPPLQVKFGPFL